uniref:G-protein coupled receptors family 1 profile domain-containing protein n=1 Tax=Denticeps clupeoides TaxID=299321 RepID=A0AAY4ET84_9TELE
MDTISTNLTIDAVIKNFVSVFLGVTINCINGILVLTFFKFQIFYRNPRYILYVNLIINDMIMLSVSVSLQVISYTVFVMNFPLCCLLLLISMSTNKNTTLNLAGMAIERYIAICKPLHHAQLCTVHRTYILLCLMWIVALIPALSDIFILLATRPRAFFSSSICYYSSIFSGQYFDILFPITQALYVSFVSFILIYTYVRVLYAAKAANTDKQSAQKAQKTILLHGVQLLLCILSYFSPIVNSVLSVYFPNSRTIYLFVTYILTNLLPRLLSPLIYGIRDQTFFKYIKMYLLSWIDNIMNE